ncbi:MAG: AEC family transporter [Opitutaceae bacterium]|nr:AEC family transporter [Opitutaceae bacterium]
MTSYWQLLQLILPVFAVMAIGAGLRRVGWLNAEADTSLLKLVVNLLYPALIFENVHANSALREAGNLAWAPLVGFVTIAGGIAVCYYAARVLGLGGAGQRTFAFTTGIYNYAYITVPLMAALFGRESLGVLFAHNVGVEAAIWTVGVLILAGHSLREGWRQLYSPPVLALVFAVGVNLAGFGGHLPEVGLGVIRTLAACAIPLGLLLSGATMAEHLFTRPAELFAWRTSLGAVALRLGVLSGLFLLLAKFGPFSADLKHVILVQATMPAAFLPLVIVKHYGGDSLTAVRGVLATVVASVVLMPLWLQWGLAWLNASPY